MTHPSPDPAGNRRSPAEPDRRPSPLTGMFLAAWLITVISTANGASHRRNRARTDDGSPTVETIGWVTFGFAIVVILGAILRDKLSALADSLPSSLDW